MRVSDLRPEVLAFAFAMEATLRKHDPKKGTEGWKKAPVPFLAEYTIREAKELYFEIKGTNTPRRVRVLEEAADTANLAMMTADAAGALMLGEAQAELRWVSFHQDQEARYAEDSTYDDDLLERIGAEGTE